MHFNWLPYSSTPTMSVPIKGPRLKTGWMNESYLLANAKVVHISWSLFYSCLNLQPWIFWFKFDVHSGRFHRFLQYIMGIPPVLTLSQMNQYCSSQTHKLFKLLFLFISVYDTTIVSVTFLNSCCGHHTGTSIKFLTFLSSPPSNFHLFYPKTRLANLLWWPNQSLLFSLLLLNHLIWCLLWLIFPKVGVYDFIL